MWWFWLFDWFVGVGIVCVWCGGFVGDWSLCCVLDKGCCGGDCVFCGKVCVVDILCCCGGGDIFVGCIEGEDGGVFVVFESEGGVCLEVWMGWCIVNYFMFWFCVFLMENCDYYDCC